LSKLPGLLVRAAKEETKMKSKEIHDAILAVEERFMAAYNRGDAPSLAALYTRDGQIMPPNSDVVAGHPALEKLFQSFWDAGDTVIKLETVEAEGSGDIAYEVGNYTLSGSTGKINDQGKYIVVWRKVDGHRKLHRDIFNTNLPNT
jgi:ketosteroid isomerase-like protein